MAVSTNTRFGNGAVVGIPAIAGDFDKFEAHGTPRHQVGWKVEDVDGNVYRYSHFGGADVDRGVLVAQDLSESSMGDSDGAIVASSSAVTTTDGLINNKFIEITATSITKNQFAGGKFIVSDDAGEGYSYDIVGNTKTNGPAASTFRLQLRQPLAIAVTTATDFIIVGNKYANLEIATSATDRFLAGVTCRSVDVSDKPYAWVQTKGTVGILQSYTTTAGDIVKLSTVTSGAVVGLADPLASGSTVNQVLGSCIIPGDTGGHGACSINLE